MAGAEAVQRFEQEARAASALNHPNILTIHDVGREGNVVYFAMEWVDGRTLRDAMAAGRLPLGRALAIAQQVAEGLARAHAAGVVHRDLKPENVMLTADGRVKIVDFGLAKLAQAGASDAETRAGGTAPGLVLGSAGYMSPEQAGGREVDYRSDQFALGLLIYEMLTGARAFARATAAQTIAATIDDEPDPIEQRAPAVPPHLAVVVSRCLAKGPAERYESTRDRARDLKLILDGQSRPHAAAPRPRRARRVWALAAAAALVAALAGGTAVWRWRAAPEAPADPEPPLVAVQAFQNLSSEPAQAYFAAGMTEEIRGQLSKVAGLRLLSRSAVEAHAGTDPSRLARELGATSLVEGTVRIDGARVRIAATLIDAATQQTLWSEQYDRELADVFAVQSEVALRIAQALQANLSPDERARVERHPTQNLEAYQLYLQARQMPGASREDRLAAVEVYRRALALDPSFAAARAEMAYRMFFLAFGDRAWLPRALEEAQEAVRTDPNLPAAHFALASLYSFQGASAQARLSFLRALELDPSHTGSMYNLSIHEMSAGRFDESLHWARRAFALSAKRGNDYFHVAAPLARLDLALARDWLVEGDRRVPPDPRVQYTLALVDVLAGRAAEGIARLEAALARWPDNDELRLVTADAAYLTQARDAEARLLEALMDAPDQHWTVPQSVRLRYAYLLDRRGDAARAAPLLAEAEAAARRRIEDGEDSWHPRFELAALAAIRDDRAQALEWLARAYDAGYREPVFPERDPMFAALTADPRFRALMARMGDDVAAQRERARERGLLDLQGLLPPGD